MAKGGGKKGEGATIVIRREEGGGHGHHGGAWKVAYADFVTAMMAFFLLMWLLNATTEQQRRGLADYFTPTNVLGRSASGSGEPFGGRTPHEAGDMTSNTGAVRVEKGPRPVLQDVELDDETPVVARPAATREGPEGPDDAADSRPAQVARVVAGAAAAPASAAAAAAADAALRAGREPAAAAVEAALAAAREADLAAASEEALRAELERRERVALEAVAEQLRNAVRDDPALADLANQLRVEQVPEGLRIQILDADRQPMFALGGSAPNERSRALVSRVAQVVARVPNAVAVTGHTDATPFRGDGRTNWDLSAERANATRRLLAEGGVAESRVRSVAGLAEREPLLPENPSAAANRRVAILLLREGAPPVPGTLAR